MLDHTLQMKHVSQMEQDWNTFSFHQQAWGKRETGVCLCGVVEHPCYHSHLTVAIDVPVANVSEEHRLLFALLCSYDNTGNGSASRIMDDQHLALLTI